MSNTETKKPATSSIDSSFPVFVPDEKALHVHDAEFGDYLRKTLRDYVTQQAGSASASLDVAATTDMEMQIDGKAADRQPATDAQPAAFMDALTSHDPEAPRRLPESMAAEGKTLTENADVTYSTTQSAIVDMFFSFEKQTTAGEFQKLLDAAWKEDPLATLKNIWNLRSIHLGKGERESFYRCLGWLAKNHPLTALLNLKWLTRPVIEKKVVKKEDAELDAIIVDAPEETEGDDQWLVRNGVSHGYWKDLLNALVLAVNGSLDVSKDPSEILKVENLQPKKRKFNSTKEESKRNKHDKEQERHRNFLTRFNEDAFYRSIHLTVARLFAEQLRADKKLLDSGDKKDLRRISLCAKWAPSLERFHDKHTFIASTIAEMLYPQKELNPTLTDRETYLKHAREAYRGRTLAPLRKALAVVERDITAENFSAIKYERVPSLAMNRYKLLFAKKDFEHFSSYLMDVAEGKAGISGAVLTPAPLVLQAMDIRPSALSPDYNPEEDKKSTPQQRIKANIDRVNAKVLDGQWKTLVQRMRDSGTLSNSIAVCDVSGSMTYPIFSDRTRPVDSAVGLSLLVAELTEPPFGGAFITFSATPQIVRIGGPGDTRSFALKVQEMQQADWGMNTDFVAVFEKLILPLALENKVPADKMVKRVFVFSDMHFDAAQQPETYTYVDTVSLDSNEPVPDDVVPDEPAPEENISRWDTSFERIQKKFRDVGYEMPELVFWNLAGGRPERDEGEQGAPKPVQADEPGCALVSGYSQAMMKMFLEGGVFEDPEDDGDAMEVVEKKMVVDEETGEEREELVVKEEKKDPMFYVKKGLGHRAYEMLEVYD